MKLPLLLLLATTGALSFPAAAADTTGPAKAPVDARAAVASPRALVEFLNSDASTADFARVLAAIAELPLEDVAALGGGFPPGAFGKPGTGPIVSLVCSRWAELDPEGLLNAVDGGRLKRLAAPGLSAAFRELSRRDPDAAWRRVLEGRRFYQLSNCAIPEAALAWCRKLPESRDRREAMEHVLGRMAQTDPERVLDLVQQPEFAFLRRRILASAIHIRALQDFDAALTRATATKNPGDRLEMIRSLVLVASPDQRRSLLALAPDLPHPAQVAIYRNEVIARSRSGDGNAVDFFDSIPSPGVRDAIAREIVAAPQGVNTRDLPALFARLPASSGTRYDVPNVAGEMARHSDPQVAIAWAQSLEDPASRDVALNVVLQMWAGRNPSAASEKFPLLTEPDRRIMVAADIARNWALPDPDAALAWAESLEATERNAAVGALVGAVAGAHPHRTGEFFTRFLAGPDDESPLSRDAEAVTAQVAGILADFDPQLAVDWARSLPDGIVRETARGAIASAWISNDPIAAAVWIDSLPPGNGRDEAEKHLVAATARDNPEAAWTRALTIQDPAARYHAVRYSLEAWLAAGNKAAARNALESSGLPEEEVRRLSATLD